MIFWPIELPQIPLRAGYSDTAPNNLLRSDMDTGPAKVRRRSTAKPHIAACSYVFDDAKAMIFEDFAEHTLAGGALAFDWWHPVLKRYVRARLLSSEDGLFTRTYFSDTLKWHYSLKFEYWPETPVEA